jgi:uncharacterized protein YjbI with pentapeptide repeats
MALTRSQIARTIAAESGLSLRNSRRVISALTGAITQALKAGEEVRIRNFGRFRVVSESVRPQKGFPGNGPPLLAAKKVVRFNSAKRLKACLQGEACAGEDLLVPNPIIEQLQKNLEIPDQIQKVLNAHQSWVDSEGRESKRADLRRFDLKGADFFGFNLKSANLSGASLPDADLSDCDLENAGLENADLTRASLAWANLRHANLRGACLRETDLRYADLRWADLSGADLRSTNLSGADLNDAVLNGADLHGARVKNTILEKKNPFSLSALKIRLKKFRT